MTKHTIFSTIFMLIYLCILYTVPILYYSIDNIDLNLFSKRSLAVILHKYQIHNNKLNTYF